MKTLLITLEYPPFHGGVANYYANLVKYWPQEEQIEALDNSQGELFSGHGPWPWFKTIKLLWQKVSSKEFDYLLVGHILPLGTASMIVSWFKKFQFAVILHGLDFTSALASPRKRFVTKKILQRSEKIICANSYLKNLVLEFDSSLENKIFVQNPGVETELKEVDNNKTEEIRNKYELDKSLNLLSIGRLVLRKGFDKVIEVMASLESKNIEGKKIKYYIIGEGEEKKHLASLIAKFNLEDRVYLLGSVSELEKVIWLQNCDIFIMPARQIGLDFEGFGIVYLEANLAGKPVIAGRSGGVEDAVKHNYSGILLDPENVEEIKEAILRLSENKDLRLRMGNNAKDRAQQEFSWQKQAFKFFEKLKK